MKLPPIELRHLHLFLAAAEHGSFRKAATQLQIRQSSISRRIGDLERLLGSQLFIRGPAGVRMTDTGQQFSCRVRDILRQLHSATDEVAAIQSKHHADFKLDAQCAGSEALTIALRLCAYCHAFADNFRLRENDAKADQPVANDV